MAGVPKGDFSQTWKEELARKLLMLARKHRRCTAATSRQRLTPQVLTKEAGTEVLRSSKPQSEECNEVALVVTTGAEGVLDTGASRTVVGSQRVRGILEGLDAACREGVRKTSSDIVFRFGNSGTLQSKHALLLPISESAWIRVEVIPGNTPLLISNQLLRELDAVIHVRRGFLQLPDKRVPMRFDSRGLSVVDLSALLRTTTAACFQTEARPKQTCADPADLTDLLPTQPPPAQLGTTSAFKPSPSVDHRHADLPQGCFEAAGQDGEPRYGRATGGSRERSHCTGSSQSRKLSRGGVCASERGGDTSCVGRHDPDRREAQDQDLRSSIRRGLRVCGGHGTKAIPDEQLGHLVQELLPCPPESSSSSGAGGGPAAQSEGHPEGAHYTSGPGHRDLRGRGRHRGLEAVPHRRESDRELSIFGRDQQRQAGEHRGPHTRDEHRPDRGAAPRHHDQEGATAKGACATGTVGAILGREGVSSLQGHAGSMDIGNHVVQSLATCRKIDACIFQIEEKLGKLESDSADFCKEMQYKLPRLDVLEVTLADSGISNAVRNRQGRAVSIKTSDANRIWFMIHMYEPKHLWINCGREDPSKVFWPRELLYDLYEHQIEQGRHFHLCSGQNIFAESTPELQDVMHGTMCAVHCPSEVMGLGKMSGNNFLNKKSFIYTTSRVVHDAIDTRKTSKHLSNPSQAAANTPAPRSQTWQLRLAEQAAAAMTSDCSVPLCLSELLVANLKREGDLNLSNHAALENAQQVVKRRRLLRKQPAPEARKARDQLNDASWVAVFKKFNVPHRGRVYFKEGDEIVKQVQTLIPQFQIKHVVMARGTNRVQLPKPGLEIQDIPLRQTIVVSRDNGKVVTDGGCEHWTKNPKYKRWRRGIPARVSLTAYGSEFLQDYHHSQLSGNSSSSIPAEAVPREPEAVSEGLQCHSNVSPPTPVVSASPPPISPGLEQGHPPVMIPRHGPGYLRLGEQEKRDLGRLHQNLGHPDTGTMVKFLTERKADPRVIQGAKDFSCSTCLESVSGPKPARPAAIHLDADFGDVLGMDVAYWSGQTGVKYMFMHILDEAMLFHQATATGRTMEDQYEALADSWNKWAGPCQLLYIDPAGEYVGDLWRERLQRDGICAKVAAGESHWQVGRVEAHGKTLKAMLSRMDAETPITDDVEFRQCLRAAIHAKNSLSRVRGFTPEQAVFGKSSRLPASLVSDELTASHALATSSLPEGLVFRQSLQRREQARAAFVRVDNDNAYRRALLRKSRATLPTFTAGSWVLYWRQQRVGSRSRSERGRWHGPAQVIVGDERVVWLSHCGQLIRASPEHLRSASLREWEALQQGQGSLPNSPERLPGRGVVDILNESDLPTRDDVEMEGAMPTSEAAPVSAVAFPPDDGLGVGHVDTGGGFEVPGASGEVPAPSAEGAEQPETEVSPAVSMEQEHEEPMELDPVEVPVPEDNEEDLLFGDSECFLIHPNSEQVWEIGLHETEVDYKDLPSPEQALHYVMIASTDRKKRTEVRLRDLNQHERQLFKEAQKKEIKAWLDHRTVRRVAAGTLEDSQLMRCRWILTWKAPEKEGGPQRAKARLVVLGFEDPGLSDIPNDAPTLGKDGRQLILQQVASRQWKLINFDISTAFLQGKGDGRKLGIKPPEELREALGMAPTDQCRLEGGAYGRIDAPFLWFQTLKQTLEELGFIQSPFDPCTFSLVTKGPGGEPRVRGVLGIHVDDGIGGGDACFGKVIEQLRGIYSFGSYDEGEFVFTGIRFRQWDDGSIEMDQTTYLEKIMPIHVSRDRRHRLEDPLNASEVHELRRLNGSLQYAAVHTRPDIAAKVGFLQSMVTKGRVKHLLEANKVLHEAKSYAVSLMVVPIPEKHVTFCTFSDASFASSKDNNSYQGTLVIATDWRMLQNQKAVIVPVAWASKKISRVVRSTLSAEVVALCGSLDRMSWLRLFWEWIKNPGIDISHPEEVLKEAPKASLVTDCKSAYDVATKTAVPNCVELRTQLECLLLRERLQENCKMRWVHSKAMLADCLTK